MFPGMDKRMMDQAMKKMGVKQLTIPASEVIIKSDGKDIIIRNPQVVRVLMMGQESFQISGDIEEVIPKAEISQDDIQTVAQQTGASEEKASEALEAANGDLAQAILSLKPNQ
jgi:nascent polypeptide-associated complex subunit alpha